MNTILSRAFPGDPIVGEEDAKEVRGDSPEAITLRNRIVDLAVENLGGELGLGEMEEWGLGPKHTHTPDQLLDAIDRGTHSGGPTGRAPLSALLPVRSRLIGVLLFISGMWTLDPIDGTKGFLRGGQYAVCLALIVDAEVQLGVIGCPNLSQDASKPDGPKGCLFVAVRGQGAEQMTISGANPAPLKIPTFSDGDLSMLESVEAAHSSHSFNDRVSQLLNITKSPTRMDSQAKYCALSRGDGGIYLRLPGTLGYVEKIWDHAPGSLLVEEAGGVITDAHGAPLNFGLGRELRENHGVVAAGKTVHAKVLAAVKQALEEGKSKV